MNSSDKVHFRWLLLFLFLFAVQVVPRILTESPTNDEPGELTNGYFYWQGDVVSHDRHPPCCEALQALPLYLLPIDRDLDPWVKDFLDRTYDFFFVRNTAHFQAMTGSGRFVTLLFGLGIGLLLFITVRGEKPLLVFSILVLWAFEPTLLALSGLAVADVPVTFFFLAAVLAFREHLKSPGWKWSLAAGALASMAVTCKFSALVLLPIFTLLEAWDCRISSKTFSSMIKDWGWGALAFASWTCLLYLPGTLRLPGHPLPFVYFVIGLQDMMAYSDHHHPSFFLGVASHHDHWLYYPVAFVLKSTLPFLGLVLLSIGLALSCRLSVPFWVAVPAFLAFACIIPVQNLGVRYLLPAYPFFILMAGRAVGWLWDWAPPKAPQAGKLLAGGLLLWHAGSVLASYPDMISYFNDLVPRQDKIRYLGDSNLDWSQDLRRLAKTAQQKGWDHLKVAQLNGVDLSLYGVKAEEFTQKDLQGPQPGWVYAVDDSFLQLGPVFFPKLVPLAQSWICQEAPTGWVGDTWFYFEVPGKVQPDASPKLGSIRTLRSHAQDEEGVADSGGN